ncbi:potassium transporter [Lactobacillus amylolyticus]|uniref:Ion channel n=1 Tax=Lactobacillus amylolyticus DSM 11664 TaxID=585524 RepID=D4YT52_9LACO|nr:ion channel [Lactobacillus amylolyticus]EFG55522.1 Ion channel [Lactobacillus amylolyticus DSM 11664]KRL19902.1 K+ channel protein [Lactobacillus amylolyticus DSM 11664]QFY05062.1 potassium transporter [Lactobacillus amylolyticus]TDG60637.1 hypothetical protein C5L18_001435 [Lactobacillus amylolyticus]
MDNGILYMLYFSIAFSIIEHVPLNRAFWWAITTASTVGYGDISTHTLVPHTMIGQFVVLVMIIIGVGMMEMVSSSLTTYFMRKNSVTTQSETQKSLKLILKKLNQLEKKNDNLAQQNEDLKEQIQAIKEQQNSSEWHHFKDWLKNKGDRK